MPPADDAGPARPAPGPQVAEPPPLRTVLPWGATADDAAAAGPLRRTKAAATAALVVAAAVDAVAVTVWGGRGGAVGFVRAGAEAAMVGGLADWFAVTALFRRPLGLPIPHTALIPRKKDDLATKLGEFVTGWFLTPEALQRQIRDAAVVERVGLWLAEPGHATTVATVVAAVAERAAEAFDRKGLADDIVGLVRRHQAAHSYAALLGRVLGAAVDGGATRPLVGVLAGQAHDYLDTHVDELRPTVRRFLEERNWLTWLVTTDRFVTRLLRDAATELADISERPEHPVRVALEDTLRRVAEDLGRGAEVAGSVDAAAAALLDDPRVREVVDDLVATGVASLRTGLAPGGELTGRIGRLVADIGRRIVDDPGWRGDVEGWVEAVVGHTVTRYGGELTGLIQRQVGDWPAAAASRRIELAVGRDLQYIRINGTVVGALAGVVIHGLSQLLAS